MNTPINRAFGQSICDLYNAVAPYDVLVTRVKAYNFYPPIINLDAPLPTDTEDHFHLDHLNIENTNVITVKLEAISSTEVTISTMVLSSNYLSVGGLQSFTVDYSREEERTRMFANFGRFISIVFHPRIFHLTEGVKVIFKNIVKLTT
jgi:hypothetical protein